MKLSVRARKAFAFLFQPYNDIDVHVEDGASRNVYEVLINRILDGRARVTRVIQMGSKREVVDACSADQAASSRRRLYVIDGDFEYVLGIPRPELQHLHRLNAYTSENLLVCPPAAIEIGYECMPNADRATVETQLDCVSHLTDIVETLTPLFEVYATAFKLNPDIQTTGLNVIRLCDHTSDGPQLSRSKTDARRAEILALLEADVAAGKYSKTELDRTLEEMRRRFAVNIPERTKLMSGKTYILPLVFHRLKGKANYAGTIEQLKVRLARFADLDLDSELSTAIRTCAAA